MKVASKTNIGSRKENQDRVKTAYLNDRTVFAIVCDGMGGANGGNVAVYLKNKTSKALTAAVKQGVIGSVEIETSL